MEHKILDSLNKKSHHQLKTMKICLENRKNLMDVGFSVNEGVFNKRQLRHLFEFYFFITLQCFYVYLVANTDEEYIISIFEIIVGILIFLLKVSLVLKNDNIFLCIDEMERIANRSKYIQFFNKQYIMIIDCLCKCSKIKIF